MEGGFTLLNKLVAQVSSNYSVMIIVVAAIIYSIKPRIIYKLSPYPFVALLVWFAMNLGDIFPVRQSIASALTMWSMLYVVQRRFWPFAILVALASTFHTTAAIFLLTYFICPLRIERMWAFALFVGSFVVAFAFEGVVSNLLEVLNNPLIQERLDSYMEAGNDETFGMLYSARQVLVRGFVNRGMIMAVIFFAINKLRRDDAVFNGWCNMFLLSSVMFFMLSAVNVALGRLTTYFSTAQMFLLPYLFVRMQGRNNRIIIFVVLVLYLLYRFHGVVSNYEYLYIPYNGLWNKAIPLNI